MVRSRALFAPVLLLVLALTVGVCRADADFSRPIDLEIDASRSLSRLVHVRLVVPVKPGPLTLFYPKWYPGEHAPTGQVSGVSGLVFKAGGKTLAWRRDLADGFAFHLEVPAGAATLEASFDDVLAMPGASAFSCSSAHLMMLRWNQFLLYPAGAPVSAIQFRPRLKLPAGWQFGTALPGAREHTAETSFDDVSLETLMDSPLLAGEFFRVIPLDDGDKPHHEIDLAADSASALEVSPELIAGYRKTIVEAKQLFGAEHYRGYHFLVAASRYSGQGGVEHHESSDDRVSEHFFQDPSVIAMSYEFLPHEYAHSWNGKYRRPADLATTDFQQTMQGDLLWVYEGLTDYLGDVLGARAGLCQRQMCLDAWAASAAEMDVQTGRQWRPTQDTADGVATTMMDLLSGSSNWPSYHRGMDYYEDGGLIWLEVDTIIRQQSKGTRSLDDFCKLFHGGASGGPQLKTYSEQDVFAGLQQIAAYDWAGFFHKRLAKTGDHAPIGGLERSGWKLVYSSEANGFLSASSARRRSVNADYSIGLSVGGDGSIHDVIRGRAGDAAELVPGMTIISVDDRAWSPDLLEEALVRVSKDHKPIVVETEFAGFLQKHAIRYEGGPLYPHLERIPNTPDLLSEILKLPQ